MKAEWTTLSRVRSAFTAFLLVLSSNDGCLTAVTLQCHSIDGLHVFRVSFLLQIATICTCVYMYTVHVYTFQIAPYVCTLFKSQHWFWPPFFWYILSCRKAWSACTCSTGKTAVHMHLHIQHLYIHTYVLIQISTYIRMVYRENGVHTCVYNASDRT
jgi:hypothetical protein